MKTCINDFSSEHYFETEFKTKQYEQHISFLLHFNFVFIILQYIIIIVNIVRTLVQKGTVVN